LPLSVSLLRLGKLEKKHTHTKHAHFFVFFRCTRASYLSFLIHTPLLCIFLFYYLKSAPFFPDFLLPLVLF
jgi:hypothetical protein